MYKVYITRKANNSDTIYGEEDELDDKIVALNYARRLIRDKDVLKVHIVDDSNNTIYLKDKRK